MRIKQWYSLYILVPLVLGSCSSSHPPFIPFDSGVPRLIITGTVTNTESEPLENIYVAVYGVREENEKDILTYNYAITDSDGQYTIIRYRGRELPAEVTIVATDSTETYVSQTLFATFTYDQDTLSNGNIEPFNGYATADFQLVKNH